MKNIELQNFLLNLTPNLWLITAFVLGVFISIMALLLAVFVYKDFIKFIQPNINTNENLRFIKMAQILNTKIQTKIPIYRLTVYISAIILSLTVSLMGLLYTASVITLYTDASSHGMYQNNLSIKEIQDLIKITPKESKLPSNLNNTLIIYYKFGCPDCSAIYNDLTDKLKDKQVYWISVKSKTGIDLLNKYPTSEVPAGLYITNNSSGVIKSLSKTLNNQTVLDINNLNYLINLKEN